MLTLDLSGKNALITASSRGIGKGIATKLAEAGADVVVNSRTSTDAGEAVAATLRDIGVRSTHIQADVSIPAQARSLVQEAQAFCEGHIDIVVNNADWFRAQMFEENTDEYWDKILNTGMKSAIVVTSAVLPFMKPAGYGKIVNIGGDSSRVGLTGGVVHTGVKGALISMTKSWARELAQHGIRVNTVSPGPIRTDLYEEDLEGTELGRKLLDTELQGLFGSGTIDDVAYAVAYLVSPWGDFVTGQTYSVNGGRCFPS